MTQEQGIDSDKTNIGLLFVNECNDPHYLGDTNIFGNEKAAVRYMEPADVIAGEYIVYNSLGKRLTPTTDGRLTWLESSNDETDYSQVVALIVERHKNIDGSLQLSI